MNSFGRIFKISIFGESHGPGVGMIIDRCSPGISISENDFLLDLNRRKPGSFGTTKRKESDYPYIKSGVFNGKTTGTPIMIFFRNKDYIPNDYRDVKYTPRPGHADLAAYKKFNGFNDWRGGGHFSGRLTVGIVAAGVIAKKLINPIKIKAKVISIGGKKNSKEEIRNIKKEGDSIGGIIECKAYNVPCGLGEPFFDSFESILSHAIFSIPGIKGIEFGVGFKSADMMGSEYNDEIINIRGKTKTNNAGGINGGISNGNNLLFRVCVRPTSSITKEQNTINLKTLKKAKLKIKGRHDVCIALRIPVILEAMTAIVLADFMMIKKSNLTSSSV